MTVFFILYLPVALHTIGGCSSSSAQISGSPGLETYASALGSTFSPPRQLTRPLGSAGSLSSKLRLMGSSILLPKCSDTILKNDLVSLQ